MKRDVEAFDKDGFQGDGHHRIHVAASRNDIETVRVLLEARVSVNLPVRPQTEPSEDLNFTVCYTPLTCAAMNADLELVKLLVEAQADVNPYHPRGSECWPVNQAAGFGRVDVVRYLLAHKANDGGDWEGGALQGAHECAARRFDAEESVLSAISDERSW